MSSWAMVFIYKFLHELWSHNPEQRNHNFLGIKFLLSNKTANKWLFYLTREDF